MPAHDFGPQAGPSRRNGGTSAGARAPVTAQRATEVPQNPHEQAQSAQLAQPHSPQDGSEAVDLSSVASAASHSAGVAQPASYAPPMQHMGYPHTSDLAHYLTATFAPQVQPLADEYTAKESARVFLEQLAQQVAPGARLLPFGSMANGFALRNSDMDLCCILDKDQPVKPASELVELLGSLIEKETNFHVKMLPRARIPIIKLTMPPTSSVPFGMSCDIGFENRLALENTRLLRTYSLVDPRLRVLVLFLKVWTKRRKINNPYRGTLSSYGFVLLVIHFLAQVKKPPVLPNLQQLPLTKSVPLQELELDGNDVTFFDDLDTLPQVWQCTNYDNVGDLLIEFFRYFSKDFTYNLSVISIRSEAGCLTKESKGWLHDTEYDPDVIIRDQYRLCIEDPFQLDYNVGRTVTRDGLYTIRGEFMRAFRLLTSRSSGHWATIINDVCEERDDQLMHHPPVDHRPSPRRRSAPSPRMMPHPGSGLPHPPPLVPPPSGLPPTGVQDFRYWAALNGVAQSGQRLDPRVFARDRSAGGGAPGTLSLDGSAVDDSWDPTTGTSSFESLPTSPVHLASASFGGSWYRNPQSGMHSPLQQPKTPVGSNTLRNGQEHPAANGSSAPSLERRSSWDGTGPATGSATSYDLHRFFQNPSSSGKTSSNASSNQAGPTSHVVEPRSAMTAPSSPDLLPQNYYSIGGFMHGPGRPHYRYSGYPVGSRLGSLPTRSPYGSTHHRMAWGPAPIFPEEDREAVALANSITFGSFPAPASMRTNGPYSPLVGNNTIGLSNGATDSIQNPTGSSIASPARSELSLGANTMEEEESAGVRGRRLMNDTIVMPSPEDVGFGVNRQRGRSVPQVRLGPDGRESILFGEIKVTLPRADTDESAIVDEDAQAVGTSSPSESTNLNASALSPPSRARDIPQLRTHPPTPLKQAPSFTSFAPMPSTPTPQSPTDFLPPFASPTMIAELSGAGAGGGGSTALPFAFTSLAQPQSALFEADPSTNPASVSDVEATPNSPLTNGTLSSPKLVPVPVKTGSTTLNAPWTTIASGEPDHVESPTTSSLSTVEVVDNVDDSIETAISSMTLQDGSKGFREGDSVDEFGSWPASSGNGFGSSESGRRLMTKTKSPATASTTVKRKDARRAA
ncbi:hypothetical protein OIV83_004795 [Microbotryomycetes sp. JL201]|nr:hypothetical protein OIV83_004795 [Microbotryomycetes sp. JL201]